MFFVKRPNRTDVDAFLAASHDMIVGSIGTDTTPAGYRLDEASVDIGYGQSDFQRAAAALKRWAHFGLGWVEVFPSEARIEAGSSVAVVIRHFGFWSMNGARVTAVVGDPVSGPTFGFTYAALPNHAEAGEELFLISRDPTSDRVSYSIRAVSRPRAALAWLGYPLVRWLQRRFRRDSCAAMQNALRPEP